MADNQKNPRRGGKQTSDARREARRAAREAVLGLLFETEYHEGETPEAIYLRAVEARELDTKERYIRKTYRGIMENLDAIDLLIGRHASGWRTARLSRVCRAVLRLGTYELVFDAKIPAPIAINEAVELTKKFDEPKARSFVNGVLNAIKNEIAENEGRLPDEVLAALAESVENKSTEVTEVTETAETSEVTETAETSETTETMDNADA